MSLIQWVPDKDPAFTIDPITREIKNNSEKKILMQKDHNSERYTFQICTEEVEALKSRITRIEIHYTNINSNMRDISSGIYVVDDMETDIIDGKRTMTFSWLISQEATKYEGTLSFNIRFAMVDPLGEEAKIDRQWFTQIYKDITIERSIYNSDTIAEETPSDVIVAIRNDILDTVLSAITNTYPPAERTSF